MLFDESQEELAKLEAAGEEFEEVKPLAEELIDTLIDLLFFADFTLPRPQNTKNKVTYAIWQSGVGCNTSIGTTKEFASMSQLKESPGKYPSSIEMVKELLADHEAVIIQLRKNVDDCDKKYKDSGTADFLTGLMEKEETIAWTLRRYLD